MYLKQSNDTSLCFRFCFFLVNRRHHPFFLGRKASISKNAFGRVFIFSLISPKVFPSSSDGPVLHLMDDTSAWVSSVSLTQHDMCVFTERGPTLSICTYSIYIYVSMTGCTGFICICSYKPLHASLRVCKLTLSLGGTPPSVFCADWKWRKSICFVVWKFHPVSVSTFGASPGWEERGSHQ